MRNNRESLIAIALLITLVLIHFSYTITNDSIPTGDGQRIFPYMEAIQVSGNFLPLWNPYKLMGIPTLGEAERFIWVAHLISIDSDYKFLLLNLVNVFGLLFIATASYLLARTFKLSAMPAVFFGVTVTSSQMLANHIKSGNLNHFIDYALILVLAPLFYRLCLERGSLLLRLAVAGGMGYVLSSTAYYALISMFPVVMLYALSRLEADWWDGVKLVTLEAFLCATLGVAIFFPLLLPLIQSSVGTVVGALPHTTLMQAQPYPYSIINTAIPWDIQYAGGVFGGGTVYFISLLLLPTLAIFVQNHQRIMAVHRQAMYLAFGLIICGLPFVMGQVFPFSELVYGFSHTPILRSIRWNISFQWLLLIGVGLFMAVVLQQVSVKDYSYSRSRGVAVLLVTFVVTAVLGILAYSFDRLGLSSYSPFVFFLELKVIGLASMLCLAAVAIVLLLGKRWMFAGMLVLFLLQVVLIHPYDEMPRVRSQAMTRDYAHILNNDDDYFYFHSTRISRLRIPKVRKMYEFSTYLPAELGRYLSALYRRPVQETRPHWIEPPSAEDWSLPAANLAGLKYLQLPNPYPRGLLKDWDVVAETKWDVLLRNRAWRMPVRLIPAWGIEGSPQRALDMAVAQGDVFDKVWLDAEPAFPPSTSLEGAGCGQSESLKYHQIDSDVAEVEIWACANKILFIPELFHKDVEVRLNGGRVPLLRADGTFRAVAVGAGYSKVAFRFHAQRLYWVSWLSTTVISALFALAFYLRWQARNKRAPNL